MGKNNQVRRKAKKKQKDARARKSESRKQLRVFKKRPCDGCTACCSVLGVKPLEKPPWEDCEHLCSEGCGIYDGRPPICGEFNCLWQCGMGTPDDRPDKLGVVFAPTDGPMPFTGEEEIQAFEVWKGALQSPRVMEISRKFAKRGALVVALPHGTVGTFRFMGPRDKVQKAEAGVKIAGSRINADAQP